MPSIEVIIAIGKICAALVVVVGGLKSAHMFIKFVIAHFNRLNKFFVAVDHIDKEMRPNGGGTLFDKINQIKEAVLTIEKRQKASHSLKDYPIFEADSKGKLTYANNSFIKLLKVSEYQLQGFGWKGFIHEDDRQRVYKEVDACIREERDFKSIFRYIDSELNPICCMVEAIAITDNNSRLIGHHAIVKVLSPEKCDCIQIK